MTEKKENENVRKLLPRKSTRGVNVNTNPEIPISEEGSDDQYQPKQAEKEKEKSVKKEKAQKKVSIARSAVAKEIGRGIVESPKLVEKEKVKQPMQEEKKEIRQVKKRKSELDNLDKAERTDTRTQRRIT